jgi:Mn-containing catalase
MVKNNVNSHNLINDIVLEEMDRVCIVSSIIKYLKKNVFDFINQQ